MKKFLLLALAAFALAACNDDDTPDEFVQGDNTIAVFENDRLVSSGNTPSPTPTPMA
mgnify:CR=1 FL=1